MRQQVTEMRRGDGDAGGRGSFVLVAGLMLVLLAVAASAYLVLPAADRRRIVVLVCLGILSTAGVVALFAAAAGILALAAAAGARGRGSALRAGRSWRTWRKA